MERYHSLHQNTMLSLQLHHIVDLYVWVDDLMPKKEMRTKGRPSTVSDSELVTLLVWNTIVLKQSTLKDIHNAAVMYHKNDFPKLPRYSAFVDHCHKVLPKEIAVLERILVGDSPIALVDSTMLEVCKLHRTDSYSVAKNIAEFGKNWQGWHFGFKLHAAVTPQGILSKLFFTGANFYDAQALPFILSKKVKIAVGDTLYGASVMRKKIWEGYGTVIVSPPFPKQNKKIATPWQNVLLNTRSKIETVFDYLKNHLHLVSSFPRSPKGYLVHYVRVLLSYQIMALTLGR